MKDKIKKNELVDNRATGTLMFGKLYRLKI